MINKFTHTKKIFYKYYFHNFYYFQKIKFIGDGGSIMFATLYNCMLSWWS